MKGIQHSWAVAQSMLNQAKEREERLETRIHALEEALRAFKNLDDAGLLFAEGGHARALVNALVAARALLHDSTAEPKHEEGGE